MACLLDAGAYPHIIECIVQLAPFEAQMTLRATCRAYRRLVEAEWCRHIFVHVYDRGETMGFYHPVLLKPIPCLPWPRYDSGATMDVFERTLHLLKTHTRIYEFQDVDSPESDILPDSKNQEYPFDDAVDPLIDTMEGARLIVFPDIVPHTINIQLLEVDKSEHLKLIGPYQHPLDDTFEIRRWQEEVVVLLWDGPVVPPSSSFSIEGLDYRKWAKENLSCLSGYLEKFLLRGGKVTVVHSSSLLDITKGSSAKKPEVSTQFWGDFVYSLFLDFLQQHSLDVGQVSLITQDQHCKQEQIQDDGYYECVYELLGRFLPGGSDDSKDYEECFEDQ